MAVESKGQHDDDLGPCRPQSTRFSRQSVADLAMNGAREQVEIEGSK